MVIITLLSLLLLFSTFYFVLTFNPIESVLWLMLSFAIISLLTFFMHLEFLAATLIILYVSAVIVLFIFIILMLPSTFSKNINIFLFYVCFIVLFVTGVYLAFYFCYFPKYSEFLFKFFFIENNLIFLNDFFLNHSQLLGLFLFTFGGTFFISLTFVFFITLFGILFLIN